LVVGGFPLEREVPAAFAAGRRYSLWQDLSAQPHLLPLARLVCGIRKALAPISGNTLPEKPEFLLKKHYDLTKRKEIIMEKQAQVVSFQESLGVFFRNYVVFGGRSSRSEFWYIALWSVLISIVSSLGAAVSADLGAVLSVLTIIIGLGALLPAVALVLRRLRDAGFSPWLILLSLVPFVGNIVVLVLCAMASKPVATEF
jgi:uncharacterized membrane protein YhaH (DUF805 family)